MTWFSLQACNQLEIACHVEQTALNLQWDAVHVMKAALVGTATTKFLDVLEFAFREEEDEELAPELIPTEVEPEEDLPKEAMTSKEEADVEFDQPSTSRKCTTRSSTKQSPVKRSRKQEAPTKAAGPFVLQDAEGVCPTKVDKAAYLHVGVPDHYILQRENGRHSRFAIYRCNYAHAHREMGESPDECDVICQSQGQTSTHVRQFHLNKCVECYVCGHRWWSTFEWKKHMKVAHSTLSEDAWFVSNEAIGAGLTVKKEVTAVEVLEDIKGGDDNE